MSERRESTNQRRCSRFSSVSRRSERFGGDLRRNPSKSQPGREALAVLMGQYAQRALQRGGRPGELPCAHFSTLSHLFGAALGCCCEHSDAGTTAKYVLSMKVLYCVEDGQERGLCAEPTVLQSPLWRNVELLEEVAWEALAHEKEQTMLQAGPGSQVSDSEDWKERREE